MKSFSKYCKNRDGVKNENFQKAWAWMKSVPSALQKAYKSGVEEFKSKSSENISHLDKERLQDAIDQSNDPDFKFLISSIIKNYDKNIANVRKFVAKQQQQRQQQQSGQQPSRISQSQSQRQQPPAIPQSQRQQPPAIPQKPSEPVYNDQGFYVSGK